jgi:hypothetical protein
VTGQMELKLKEAVARFWLSRDTQAQRQGSQSGTRDTGSRAAVTGGSQMDGFVELVRDLLEESGMDKPVIYCERCVEIPGWFRPEKKWDLLVVVEGCLIAAIEFKSQVGSFGNNYNNRTEEAIGSATDLWAAYREGAFKPSARPWLGYVMLLEEATGSTRPVKAQEPHFKVFDEFKSASYARRYEILLTKLMRERLYDATCFLMSTSTDGPRGQYTEPVPELSFTNFVSSLLAKAIAYKKTR